MPVVFSRGEQKALRPLNNDSNNNDTTNIRSDRYQDEERRDWQFFCFICISTALRSFEAGIVASMMADIQADLNLDTPPKERLLPVQIGALPLVRSWPFLSFVDFRLISF